jgi:methylglutaconyl-CoA hydratase
MAFETLHLDWEDALALVTINRPEKRNAMSPLMANELMEALGEIEHAPARVAILTGAGTVFSAGVDIENLRQLTSQSFEENLADSRRMAGLFHRLYSFPKPLIAAVNGHAIAGGCGLATLCDFTLAVPAAKFGYTEARIGFIPALVSVFLIRQIGEKRARDLLLTGRLIDAAEAQRLGLVNEVVPAEQLLARARELAGTLIANSPVSLHRTKALLLDYSRREFDLHIDLAIDANAQIRSTEDFREGISAFLEKRQPTWTGR